MAKTKTHPKIPFTYTKISYNEYDSSFQYYEVNFVSNFGRIKKNDDFTSIVVDYEKGIIEYFINNQRYEQEFNINAK